MQLKNTESKFDNNNIEKRRLQWIKDVELLAFLCAYKIEEDRPMLVGNERDEELPVLYLYRDNPNINRLIADYPDSERMLKNLTLETEDSKIDKVRISKDKSFWGTFIHLPIYDVRTYLRELHDNKKLLEEGEIIKDFPGFLYERFEPLINEEIKGKGKVFEKIATRNCRPVKRSDLWDAWDYLRNDKIPKELTCLHRQVRKRGRPKKNEMKEVRVETFHYENIPVEWEEKKASDIWLLCNKNDKTGHIFRSRLKTGLYNQYLRQIVDDSKKPIKGKIAVSRAWYYQKTNVTNVIKNRRT